MEGNVRKVFFILLMALLLLGCSPTEAQIQEDIDLTETARPTSTQTITPSKTITKTKTATSTVTTTATKTQEPTYTATKKRPTRTNTPEPESNVMHGVSTGYIQVMLEEVNFDCEVVYAPTSTDPYYKWECTREDLTKSMILEMWSPSFEFISLIRTRIIQYGTPDDSVAINYLGFIATLPYDGSNPQQAKEWVENALPTLTGDGDVQETIIGGIRFSLYGNEQNISMKIGEDL